MAFYDKLPHTHNFSTNTRVTMVKNGMLCRVGVLSLAYEHTVGCRTMNLIKLHQIHSPISIEAYKARPFMKSQAPQDMSISVFSENEFECSRRSCFFRIILSVCDCLCVLYVVSFLYHFWRCKSMFRVLYSCGVVVLSYQSQHHWRQLMKPQIVGLSGFCGSNTPGNYVRVPQGYKVPVLGYWGY